MIVWGGFGASGVTNTGGSYNPGTNSWTEISRTNTPSARSGHTAVWTGSEMMVWGGWETYPNGLNTGGRYCADFASSTPTPTATATATATATVTATPKTYTDGHKHGDSHDNAHSTQYRPHPVPHQGRPLHRRRFPTPRVRPTPPPRP